MKAPFNEQQSKVVSENLQAKKKELSDETLILTQYIKDKAPSDLVEGAIRKRNVLFIDVANLEKQLNNLKYGRKQYGCELQEKSVRKWID
jgi:hypothetical protein